MPRDGNGNYTLPAGNPVIADTLIASSWANDTMNDMANEMQDSLSRSGKGGLTAPLGVVDFSGSVPGLSFTAEPTSGLKRQTTEDVRIQITATDVLVCQKTGVQILSGGSLKTPVVEETGQKVMRGDPTTTVCFFYNDTPPTGWSLQEPDANVRELVIGPSGGGEGGTIGGSIDPTNLAQAITVTISGTTSSADINHGHTFGPITSSAGATGSPYNTASGPSPSPAGHTHTVSGTTDFMNQNAVHDHTFSDTDDIAVSIAPRYARGILAVLDA